ncbi:hypothetical protein BDV93DRAFT_44453 [Ceratobasidium sp. AG-I]|nr:hypothetical protein BDV93DRAFT_44453 [Ceratobasidium sp. AG-I]
MSIPDVSWEIPLTIAVVSLPIVIPAIFKRLRALRTPQPPPGNGPPNPQPVLRQTSSTLKTMVVSYSFLAIFFWYSSQPDLFTRLRLPINTPTDSIRSALLTQRPLEFIPPTRQGTHSTPGRADAATSHPLFSPELDRTLQRIDTFEIRLAYARLGHNAISSCEWCTTREDYVLFAAAGLSLAYVALLCMVGVVTEAPERRKRRVWAAGIVIVAAAVDASCTGFVKGAVRRGDHVQYHVRARRFRLLLHLALPTILLSLPPTPPYLTQETYMQTLQALSALSHVSAAQQSTMKHTRYAGLVRDASVSSWAEATMRSVDGALADDEFRATLDIARPDIQVEGKGETDEEKDAKPAAERLKEWAGKLVGETLKEVEGLITNRGTTPGVQ